jgi:hypothetical protein
LKLPAIARGSVTEVFRVSTRLGLSCFGGPIAHLGYFRDEYVVKRRWLDEERYADLIALSQFLPGAASSKVGSPSAYCGPDYAAVSWPGSDSHCRRPSPSPPLPSPYVA